MDLPPHVPEPVRAALAEAKARLVARYGDRLDRLILYGSHARGEAHDESDVDVLVVLRGEFDVYEELRGLSQLRLDLSLEHQVDCSLQPYSVEDVARPDRAFLHNVTSDGVSV